MNIVHACENLADHTHPLLSVFCPRPGPRRLRRPALVCRLAARGWPAAAQQWLAARALLLRIVGPLARRWPHPGAANRRRHLHGDAAERLRLLGWLAEVRRFVETTLLGLLIDAMLAIDHPRPTGASARRWRRQRPLVARRRRAGLCPTWPRTIIFGVCRLRLRDGETSLAGRRVGATAQRRRWNLRRIQEDVSHSWYAPARHPAEGDTRPNPHKHAAPSSWNKARASTACPPKPARWRANRWLDKACAAGGCHGGSVFTRAGLPV